MSDYTEIGNTPACVRLWEETAADQSARHRCLSLLQRWTEMIRWAAKLGTKNRAHGIRCIFAGAKAEVFSATLTPFVRSLVLNVLTMRKRKILKGEA